MVFMVVVFIILAALMVVIIDEKNGKARIKKITDMCKEDAFEVSQIYIGNRTGIALDENSKKVCLINDFNLRFFPYTDILSSEIKQNGIEITKTSRSSQLAGALVGGVLFGGVGAIIGGLSGSKSSSNDKIKDLELNIIVNDIKNPVHTIPFLGLECKKDDAVYIEANKKAQHWFGIMSVIIKQNEHAIAN